MPPRRRQAGAADCAARAHEGISRLPGASRDPAKTRSLLLVHLLQVYSNPAPEVVAPQELLFRSTARAPQQASRAPRRRARQLRASEVDRVVARYLTVRNIRTVAIEFQVSRTTVARILAEHGIDASRRMTDAQVSAAAKLYAQGRSSAAIGQRLGFDNHTILKALRDHGVAVRGRSIRNKKTTSEEPPHLPALPPL